MGPERTPLVKMPQPQGSEGSEGFATASLHPFGGTKDASSRQGDAPSGLLASLNLTYRFIYTPKNEGISNKRWEETIPNSWRSLGRRWWQLKDLLIFYPEPWGFMIQVD